MPPEPRDSVDRILDQWRAERPDLDPWPMGVIGRLNRLGALIDSELRPVFADAGLGDGEFDVVATLRRAGAPYTLSPGDLAAQAMVTSGAITKRVDRLMGRGLVRRSVSVADGRGRAITLTDEGVALVDRLVEQHLANERRVIGALSRDEADELARLLKLLLLDLEGPAD